MSGGWLIDTNVLSELRRADLHDWLTHRVRPMFEHRTLEVSEDVMLRWRCCW